MKNWHSSLFSRYFRDGSPGIAVQLFHLQVRHSLLSALHPRVIMAGQITAPRLRTGAREAVKNYAIIKLPLMNLLTPPSNVIAIALTVFTVGRKLR